MILGLDVAFRNIGWVKIDPATMRVAGAGCLRTERRATKSNSIRVADDDVRCCMELASELSALMEGVRVIAAEMPTGGAKGDRANRSMGMATGVVAAICEFSRIPTIFVSPGDSKKFSTGARNASKEMMAAAAVAKFPTLSEFLSGTGTDEHICDAVCAVTTAQRDAAMRMVLKDMTKDVSIRT